MSKVLVLLPRMKLRKVFDAKTETVTVGKENNLGSISCKSDFRNKRRVSFQKIFLSS